MRSDATVGLSLTAAEVSGAREYWAAELSRADTPDAHLAAGLTDYVLAYFADSREHLRAAFLAFQRIGNRRRAAVAAAHLGRLEYDGVGHIGAANGWSARAHRLIAGEPRCVDRGWVLLGRVACSFSDTDELEAAAREALDLADAFGEVDLECKALADLGLALLNRGRTNEGMTLLDEAMTMTDSGECDNAFIAAQVYCCIVSACERAGDLARMEALLTTLQAAQPGALDARAAPNLLLAHCQGEYGSLLCGSGRWREAEAALRRAVQVSEQVHFRPRARAHAALADLRVSQGRLPEAAAALDGYTESIESQLPLTRLHLARGDHALAAAVARRALRELAGDAVRAAPLLACLVQAELGRGELVPAQQASDSLHRAASGTDLPHLQAISALTRARIAAANACLDDAIEHVEHGLTALQRVNWPLLAADLHLELAKLLAAADPVAARAEARQALSTFTDAGSVRMHDAQAVLHQLGDSASPITSTTGPQLTARERQVLRLLANGASNPKIAQALVISTKTAEHHVSSILRKLQLTSRSEAAVYAATLGEPQPAAQPEHI